MQQRLVLLHYFMASGVGVLYFTFFLPLKNMPSKSDCLTLTASFYILWFQWAFTFFIPRLCSLVTFVALFLLALDYCKYCN